MAIAPSNQTQRRGAVSVLMPPPAPPATPLSRCLGEIERRWTQEGHLAGLWRVWPRLVGPQLAPHCRPLSLRGGTLMVGAPPGPWLQALQYNRHQLLGSLRGAGFSVRELRVQQHNPQVLPRPAAEVEAATWAAHPSRVDVHGMATCPCCARPAPAGELERWRRCSFCQRDLFAAAAVRVTEPPTPKPSDTRSRASLRRQDGFSMGDGH
jgi:predicted nucleic acid-binding Zn ribbon protein